VFRIFSSPRVAIWTTPGVPLPCIVYWLGNGLPSIEPGNAAAAGVTPAATASTSGKNKARICLMATCKRLKGKPGRPIHLRTADNKKPRRAGAKWNVGYCVTLILRG
jgi:hypothetical protein